MSNKNPIYLGISLLALVFGGLSFEGYISLNKKYMDLDKKFDATADTLLQYKATLQNQGLYGPLKKQTDNLQAEVTQLKGYLEAFFDGSEKVNKEFGEEILRVKEKLGKLETKADSLKK